MKNMKYQKRNRNHESKKQTEITELKCIVTEAKIPWDVLNSTTEMMEESVDLKIGQ